MLIVLRRDFRWDWYWRTGHSSDHELGSANVQRQNCFADMGRFAGEGSCMC